MNSDKKSTDTTNTFKIGSLVITKPGMRIYKTALAVFLCFLLDRWHGNPPITSAIAAIICIQNTIEKTLYFGKERISATVLGGVLGGISLTVFNYWKIDSFSLIFALIVATFLIPLIYIMVLTKRRENVTLACIVFIIICFSGSKGSAFTVAFNYTASNIIGILVAWLVNKLLPFQTNLYNDCQSSAKADSNSKSESDSSKSEPDSESKPESDSKSKPESDSKSKSESDSESSNKTHSLNKSVDK